MMQTSATRLRASVGTLVCIGCAAGALLAAPALADSVLLKVGRPGAPPPDRPSVSVLELGTDTTAGLLTDDQLAFGTAPGAPRDGGISFSGASGLYGAGAPAGNYLMAGPGGTVSLQFNAAQRYFGLLWGSSDPYETLSFYAGNTLVESITGAAIAAAAPRGAAGDGTHFVKIDFTDPSGYDRVVASGSSQAFELSGVAFGQRDICLSCTTGGGSRLVPVSPAPAAPLGATPFGLFMLLGTRRLFGRQA